MRPGADLPDYGTPFCLFGNAPPRAARSLSQLVTEERLSAAEAESLVALTQRRVSLVIAAPAAARGKSTLLAALLPYLPPWSDRYHLRGSFETFRFVDDRAWQPRNAVLVANEISDFLPVYLPLHLTRPLFHCIRQGACLWATGHARGMADLLAAWPEWPPTAPLAVVTIDEPGPGVIIELNDPARRLGGRREPGRAIDNVCHAEGGTGSGTDALPVCVSASGLRPTGSMNREL